jgi:hypothetical protein
LFKTGQPELCSTRLLSTATRLWQDTHLRLFKQFPSAVGGVGECSNPDAELDLCTIQSVYFLWRRVIINLWGLEFCLFLVLLFFRSGWELRSHLCKVKHWKLNTAEYRLSTLGLGAP